MHTLTQGKQLLGTESPGADVPWGIGIFETCVAFKDIFPAVTATGAGTTQQILG